MRLLSYAALLPLLCLALLCLAVGCGGDDTTRDAGTDAFQSDVGAPDTSAPADASSEDDAGPPDPGAWQLPEGYYTPARMPMALVHPRDDDAAPWAYAKNAYPGIRWAIPVVVQGGAWPFRYEIVDDGGATGLRIGEELARSVETGFVVHRVDDRYGRLVWEDPVAGDYAIQLRVTDQQGDTLDVPLSLRVGTEGWVFVDPATGDDTNAGTREAPFASLAPLYAPDGGPSPHATDRVYLVGTVPMLGNRDNGNLRVADEPAPGADLAPRVWLGLPGSDAALEAYEGRLLVDAADFTMAGLTHRHREDYAPSGTFIHMMTVYNRSARFLLHDVTFDRFQGAPENRELGNSSVVMFTRGADRPHVAVTDCTLTGESGIFTSTYSLRTAVFERNVVRDANLTLSDGSVWGVIYIKGDNDGVTLRANVFGTGNRWDGPASAIGVLEARRIEVAHNVLDVPYESGRRGAIKLWTNSPQAGFEWTADTPVWLDRNSIRQRIHWEGNALANMPPGTVRITHNALAAATVPEHERIVAEDNLLEATFDDAMNLDGAARADLGRRGAAIAVPE